MVWEIDKSIYKNHFQTSKMVRSVVNKMQCINIGVHTCKQKKNIYIQTETALTGGFLHDIFLFSWVFIMYCRIQC